MDFDAKKAVDATVKWISDWFKLNGPGCNAIIGISGGKDSSITAALLVQALGKERVIGIMMPNGEQSDMDMALLLIDHLGIESHVINIEAAYNGAVKQGFSYQSSSPPQNGDSIRRRSVEKWQGC